MTPIAGRGARRTHRENDPGAAAYLVVSCTLSAAAGGIYGAGLIGVPALDGMLLVAGVVSLVGYAPWDERHYG